MEFTKITGKIEVLTGLHIGGSKEFIEIGGMDNPILREPHTGEPYIPGSSIKGKMRSYLELHLDRFDKRNGRGLPCSCNDPNCPVCRVFGSSNKEAGRGPTRLLVRDAHLSEDSRKRFGEGETITECKYENSIDRITGVANPRPLERVVRGVTFDFEMVYKIIKEDDKKFFPYVAQCLKALENDAIGGCSSRGCGKIRILDLQVVEGEKVRKFNSVDEWLNELNSNN